MDPTHDDYAADIDYDIEDRAPRSWEDIAADDAGVPLRGEI